VSKAEFEAWWAENDGKITDILRSLGAAYGNPLDTDDLKSETFLRCWCSNPNSVKDGYSRWIWVVAKSVIGDAFRQQKRQEQTCLALIQPSNEFADSVARIVMQRLRVELRIEILGDLYREWTLCEGDWDARSAKRKLLYELARRIEFSMPISAKAIAEIVGLSSRHVRRLLNEIANEILEIEDAEVQSLRCPDTVRQNGEGQLATDQPRRVKSHGNVPISRIV